MKLYETRAFPQVVLAAVYQPDSLYFISCPLQEWYGHIFPFFPLGVRLDNFMKNRLQRP